MKDVNFPRKCSMDTTQDAKPLFPCHCANMRLASRVITHLYDRKLTPSGLTSTQYHLLRLVAHMEPINMSQLAKYAGLDRTTLVRNFKPLSEQGFIVDAPGADRRTRELRITESGREAIDTASVHWFNAQESLGKFLGPQQLETLLVLLGKIQAFPG